MSVKVKDIMGVMEEIAPKRLAEGWDKPGLAIGDPEREVKKILVALDVMTLLWRKQSASART